MDFISLTVITLTNKLLYIIFETKPIKLSSSPMQTLVKARMSNSRTRMQVVQNLLLQRMRIRNKNSILPKQKAMLEFKGRNRSRILL